MDSNDGFVKSPSAALPCILRRCGVLPSTPHSSGFVRLASGAFYEAISLATLYEIIKIDGFVKSPSAALPCILRRCGVPGKDATLLRFCAPGPAKRGRAFYFAIPFDGFLRDHQNCLV
ncbi:MAG: hypothetical protein NTY64_07445 [Deltaproteobacteria bacterium]|nr:hypothetical protein [Deltaproteobacteria bacterium]